jgi:hypothetical protein
MSHIWDTRHPVVSLVVEAKSSVTPEHRGQNPHLTPQEPIFPRKSVKSSIFTLFGAKFSRSHPAAVAPICPISCRSGVLRHGGMANDTTDVTHLLPHAIAATLSPMTRVGTLERLHFGLLLVMI